MTEELVTLTVSKTEELIIGMGLSALFEQMTEACDDGPEMKRTVKRICDLLDRMDQHGAANTIWTKYMQL